MISAAVVAKTNQKRKQILEVLRKNEVGYNSSKPDFVVCLGGDGTYLEAERLYPSVPKLLLKDSLMCKKCPDVSLSQMVRLIIKKGHKLERHIKLEAFVLQRTRQRHIATNDVIIRSLDPTQALRFRVYINNKKLPQDLFIGDGIVVATPFGSTGYFHSITRTDFLKGIGVALNNCVNEAGPIITGVKSKIVFELIRGRAQFASDNSRTIYLLISGDKVEIRKHERVASIIVD